MAAWRQTKNAGGCPRRRHRRHRRQTTRRAHPTATPHARTPPGAASRRLRRRLTAQVRSAPSGRQRLPVPPPPLCARALPSVWPATCGAPPPLTETAPALSVSSPRKARVLPQLWFPPTRRRWQWMQAPHVQTRHTHACRTLGARWALSSSSRCALFCSRITPRFSLSSWLRTRRNSVADPACSV